MYGQGHAYCEDCGHIVRRGHPRCTGCGTLFSDLMMADLAFDNGFAQRGSVGYDPLDGSFAFNIGGGLAIEPDGQVDLDIGGFDLPI
jgi:hypothetical protein